jgi:hypothetical protein
LPRKAEDKVTIIRHLQGLRTAELVFSWHGDTWRAFLWKESGGVDLSKGKHTFAYGHAQGHEFIVHEDLIDGESVSEDLYQAYIAAMRKVGW